MNRLIGDLVDVASIDAGRLHVARDRADASVLLREAIDLFQGAAAAKGLAVQVAAPPDVTASFDRDRILQVLVNLITNAIKFTPAGGVIRLEVFRGDDAVVLSVADTGAGIPSTMLESVFERFWQASQDDRRGVGLGLYISRSIVQAHGGRIWVDSTPGAGSRFSFTIPFA